ncbi:alpha/beta hydrolase [Algicella marina]|nr:alpha/beta hydrolase [Algicella marina]
MGLLGLSLRAGNLVCADGSAAATRLRAVLSELPPSAPLVIMLHGYRFTPDDPYRDPHRLIFAMEPERKHWKLVSWPRGLGFSGAGYRDGLAIGFAWPGSSATGLGRFAIAHTGFADAYARAATSGTALAGLLERIADIAPTRKVDILAHSLGARVALQAMRSSDVGNIGRVMLMGGAEFRETALDCLANYRGAPEIYNITARSNLFYDHLFRRFAPGVGGPALGEGLQTSQTRCVDIDLDCPRTGTALRQRGFPLERGDAAICHWNFYLRRGALPLYGAIFRQRHSFRPADLRRAFSVQEGADLTWPEAVPPAPLLPLPNGGKCTV